MLGSTQFLSLWLSSPLSQFFYSLRFSLEFHLSQIILLQTIHKNLSRATITKQNPKQDPQKKKQIPKPWMVPHQL